jgi:hypothetical protein
MNNVVFIDVTKDQEKPAFSNREFTCGQYMDFGIGRRLLAAV